MSNVIIAFSSFVTGMPEDRAGTPALNTAKNPRQSFRPIATAAIVGAGLLLRRRYLQWGATPLEQQCSLAGDELLPVVDMSATRAISIEAAAGDIWPWIAQLGQGRGGFYSYDWLENLVPRVDIHNADHIVAEWQDVAVGAEVRLAPDLPLTVAALEQDRSLVLSGGVPMGKAAPPYQFTWSFVLTPQSAGTTRLVVRERYFYTRRWAALIVQPAALVSCLMSHKMLRGIKIRAERASTALPHKDADWQLPVAMTHSEPTSSH